MKTSLAIKIVGLFVLTSSQLFAAGEIICTSQDQINNIIQKTENVVVDFHNEKRCPPCIQLAPIFQKIASEINAVTFVKVNISEVNVQEAIRSIPTLIFYKNGKKIGHHTGYLSETALRDLIQKTFAL